MATFNGGMGNDSWTGISGVDTAYGNDGNDGNDTLDGTGGDDRLFGGAGNDSLTGGSGIDAVDYSNTGTGVVVDLAVVGAQSRGEANGDVRSSGDLAQLTVDGVALASTGRRIEQIEVVLAGAGADIVALDREHGAADQTYSTAISIFGGAGTDIVYSGDGADLVVGGDANPGAGDFADTLFGGAGADVVYGDDLGAADMFYGGDGDDAIIDYNNAAGVFGGLGDDVVNLAYSSGSGTVALGDGHDSLFVGGSYSLVTATGGAGIDSIDDGDVISTWNGHDVLFGGAGNDWAWGSNGADTIYGVDGLYFLYDGGIDQAWSAAGALNLVYGGGGADYFYIGRGERTQIFDDGTGGNTLVLFGRFDLSPAPTALMISGTGVGDMPSGLGYTLCSNTGGEINVSCAALGGGVFQATVDVVDASATALNDAPRVVFSTADVQCIVLWNSDGGWGQVQEQCNWNSTLNVFTFSGCLA